MEGVGTLGRRPALDGLRAIAVACVALFHFNTKEWLPGGSLGVDLFFALSGFLITVLLVEEWRATGSLSLRRFYLRRALRLAPTLAVFVAIVSGVQIAFRDDAFTGEPPAMNTLGNAVLGMSYVYNWFIVFGGLQSNSFLHLWTLSIEMQFYLVWPAVLLGLLKCGLSFKLVLVVAAFLAAASASVPLMVGGESWERLYYGSEYRIHGLLLGSVMGVMFASGLVQAQHVRHLAYILALVAGALYIATLMVLIMEDVAYVHLVGFPAVGVSCSLIVLGCAFVEGGTPMRALGNGVMTYIGRRSYAIYLWHFPLAFWFREFGALEQLLVAGGLTLIAAELSYRLVEGPALSLKARLSWEGRRLAAPAVALASAHRAKAPASRRVA